MSSAADGAGDDDNDGETAPSAAATNSTNSSTTAAAAASLPCTTSDFLIGEVIGEGSFGRVLHCKHKISNRDVAIKVFEKVVLRKRPSSMHSLLNEQRILKQLRNISSSTAVNLLASFDDTECAYLVMECATGGTLHDAMKEGRSSRDWLLGTPSASAGGAAAHYSLQILKALEEIHSRHIVHADLCPKNILLTHSGRILLADFGGAFSVSLDNDDNDVPTTGEQQDVLNNNNNNRGCTVDYACPEILKGVPLSKLTYAVDLWSFGCILYEMMVVVSAAAPGAGGQQHQHSSPFHADSDALAIQKVCNFAREEDPYIRRNILFPNNDDTEDELAPTSWMVRIEALLEPDPQKRLEWLTDLQPQQTSDVSHQNELVGVRWYYWGKKASLWKDVDLSRPPAFLPKTPEWFDASKSMRDGNLGWSAFLT